MAHQHTQQPITTGGSVIGLKYKDGVMIASDTMVAYGSSLRFKDQQRIHAVGKNTLVGASGEFSDFQHLQDMTNDLDLEDWQHQDGCEMAPKAIASYLGRVLYNRRSKVNPLWNQLVIGGMKNGEKSLHYADLQGTFYEEDFMATGFGMHLAMPILRQKWREDLTEAEARELCCKCLELLFYRDCKASRNVQIAISNSSGTTIEKPKDLPTFWAHKTWTMTNAELNKGVISDSW